MRRFLRGLGRFLGTALVGIIQGTAALVGEVHRALHREFGQPVWVFYTLTALVVWLYFTGGLLLLVAQLFALVQQLMVLGIIILGLGIMIRGVIRRR